MAEQKMADKPRYRIVTPEQFSEGYLVMIRSPFSGAAIAARREFVKVRTLPDGNILVKEPEPEGA